MSMSLSASSLIIPAHVCLFMIMTTTSIAQFVLDTNGEPVEGDKGYFIRPVITNNGGRFTLVNRNGSCPLHVGLENTHFPQHSLAVKFTPFSPHHDFDDVRLNQDLRVTFQASPSCEQSTEWRLGEITRTGRRLIATGRDDDTVGSYGNFFRIIETRIADMYNIQWCPTEVCPNCRFECGTIGTLLENEKILLALDGSPLPIFFEKE
ncbi:kunitz type trypsin inhibitor 106-like [Vicia villosa]|uniref:kunitz type trypsin inhibitor 106-like n=1 Tax=Vicia villosa TaxID=3911 RepID=UPI00273C80D0|nr:kunitz type trypsin inhibitor 106-like [Vicia villosa]